MNQAITNAVYADSSPFHPGERLVQARAGVREEAEQRGRHMLSADLNEQQVQFFQRLPFVIIGHLDNRGQPRAGLVTGNPGFIAIDAATRQYTVDWRRAVNPTKAALRPGDELALLGIDLQTRRRNRLNGTVFAVHDNRWRLLLDQGYGNCPQYITSRDWPADRFAGPYRLASECGLSAAATRLAERTDTFFIATASGARVGDGRTRDNAWGADVSHRGGEPGFLRRQGNLLSFEDFPGNNLFNTLGNIQQYPACGLLLLDFDSGDILQLDADAHLEQHGDARAVRLRVTQTRHWHAQRGA